MLKILNQLFASKWVTFLLLYLGLLGASYGYQWLNQEELIDEHSIVNIEDASIVVISDPVLSEKREDWIFERDKLEIHLDNGSIQQNAININKLLDSLGIKNYHLVGEGIGGSVAMHMASNPDTEENLLSLIIVDTNGVVELEMLGGSFLNQTIYKGKASVFKLLYAITPHFGGLDFLLDHYSKLEIQSKSDQLLIRSVAKEIQIPVAIVHTQDAKVSGESANELHRIIPQSQLWHVDENVLFISKVELFYDLVESGNAVHRYQSSMAAQILALQPFDSDNSLKAEGNALLVLMLVIIFSTFISEDLTCIGTGLLIARGMIGFIPGSLACLIGIFIGDILLYLLGRWVASSTLHRAPLKWFVSEKDMKLSYHWFEARGPVIIIASRFIPGTRLPTYVSAGAIGANFFTFIIYFGIASILWTPMLVGLSVILGNQMIEYFSLYQEYAVWVFMGVMTLLFVLIKVIIPSITFKGRRILIGKYRRLVHWEFWSPVVLYAPVLMYLVLLWIKHKSITLVTLANPGIRYGGFKRESKSEILCSIKQTDTIADFRLIEADTNAFYRCEQFMKEHKIEYPVVLKPDVGERGKDVMIPKNKSELKNSITRFRDPFIIQEFIDGLEFGVFYMRYPTKSRGNIISITQKEYMWLTGDGKHTLEELILNHERAVCMAKTHFQEHVDQLYKVYPKGKMIKLVEIGTHSRGAIFKDAIHLNSESLMDKMDEISKSIDGFYFGRFDIKVPNETHFKEGSELKILELNGITSEETHIYDPKYPFWYAVKTLCRQWKMAYEIASEVRGQNKKLKLPRLGEVLGLLT